MTLTVSGNVPASLGRPDTNPDVVNATPAGNTLAVEKKYGSKPPDARSEEE
jgi:hypothetical protein